MLAKNENSIFGNLDNNMKLQKELENLATLQESLEKYDGMTDTMLSILNTFERRLTKLEETIMPVYQETSNLQRRHENIEKTMSSLDHVIGFYTVAEDVEPIIRDGPGSGLDEYISAMDRLSKAVKYLNTNNPGSPEMSQVTTLYESGKESMEKEFRNILTRSGAIVSPAALLSLLQSEEDGEISSQPIEQFPAKVLTNLKQISTWLQNCGYESDFVYAYTTHRSAILIKSLNSLKDHLKSSPMKDSNTSLNYSPLAIKKGSFRRNKGFVGKAANILRKQNAPNDPINRNLLSLKDDGVSAETNYFSIMVQAFISLIQGEAGLMQGIIATKHQRRVFEQIVQAPLDFLKREGEQIGTLIRKATSRQNILPVVHLLPVLKLLRLVRPDFDLILEGCSPPTRASIPSLISSLDVMGAKALEEFVENIRNNPDKQSSLPKDGTVHELTSNTMLLLEQLIEFSDTVGSMILTQDPISLSKVPDSERPRMKLAEFLTKVLSSLGLNLGNKSESYSDTALRSIFMLNNFNYILTSLKRSGLIDIAHLWNNEVATFYEDQLVNQKRLYSQGWTKALSIISENQQPVSPLSQEIKLKDKDKSLIKEKFTAFNKELEEVCKVQKLFTVPDQDLRTSLKEDNTNFILQFYKAFYNRYSSSNFSKHPEKYIKYKVEDVKTLLDGIFSGGLV